MENNLKAKFVKITLADMGITEDEWNNFLIDCHGLVKGDYDKQQYHWFEQGAGNMLVVDKPTQISIVFKKP